MAGVDNDSNISSILGSENNNVIGVNSTLSEWLRQSVLNRSIFGRNLEVGDELFTLVIPAKYKIDTTDHTKAVMTLIRFFSKLHDLYRKDAYKSEDIELFFDILGNSVYITDGFSFSSSVWSSPKNCAYIGTERVSRESTSGTVKNCKQRHLDGRTSKYVDLVCNTVVLFLRKIAKTTPELLLNHTFSTKPIYTFLKTIQNIYYFIGSKYYGNRLCNRLHTFVVSVNKIFQTVAGYDILREEGKDGNDMCGHGILIAQASDGNKIIVIANGNSDTGLPETRNLGAKGYTLLGGGRLNRTRKQRRLKAKEI
jgi:hypothetical protein